MKTSDRILPAVAFALLGAFLGALVCVMVVLKTDVMFASLPMFSGVGAAVLAVFGWIKGPCGPGYVRREGHSMEVDMNGNPEWHPDYQSWNVPSPRRNHDR